MKKCRDCGKLKELSEFSRRRANVCQACIDIRVRVIKAIEAKEIPPEHFQKYQRGGLRTKRLIKMGYGHLVNPPTPARQEEESEEKKG